MAARRLAAAWKAGRVSGGKASQKELAGRWGNNPSLVSQYLNGHLPLNVKWQLRFAEYLGVSPIKIWPDFAHKNLLNTGLEPEALDVALDYQELDGADRAAVRHVMASIRRKRA